MGQAKPGYTAQFFTASLTFKSHLKKMSNSIKFNLQNLRHIRNNLMENAARMFLDSMIFSRLEYCLTSWSLACTTRKPIEPLYNKALKVFDKKPLSSHHCNILAKHKLLSFNNLIDFEEACLVYKAFHGLAPPPLNKFIKQRADSSLSARATRASTRGDCDIRRRRTTFG